ncbi:DnaJ C-terminal domain-containing protein [Amaricoccus solimangrovi]|uniref:J domain-containing protein n=1 Tax=Amaricoccus solimangrovi TaxID=2589815 RepID=A0A501WWS0_9RHOB|nr:DnaJ C-terminal domain-containing protein [Amaricoccus solimangrovi]TPE53719.1 J domain-containing protein [Amaricoccus solimangrovi]
MQDPYATLGVQKTATDKEIRSAFKKLTRKHHPDLHPGDKAAEDRFKEISAAYDLLGDAEKRRRFDAGEIDATGAERPREQFYRDFAEQGGGRSWSRSSHAAADGFASDEDLEDLLNRAFGGMGGMGGGMGGMGGMGGGRGGGRAEFRARGQDVSYALPVAFLDAVNGAKRAITLPDGKTLAVTIPEGAVDRQMLRLRGQGGPGFNGGPAGDAYVELHVEPHAFFHRKDTDIHVEVPVTLTEAVLGARIEVPTISGPVSLTIPRNSNTGRKLRLRDKGVLDPKGGTRGHQYVTLRVVLPDGEEPELEAFLKGWTPVHARDPRKEML